MKSLKETIFAVAVVLSLGLGVSAQDDDQRKPKKDPPVIKPGDKPRPPKGGGGRPKKPGYSFYLVSAEGNDNVG